MPNWCNNYLTITGEKKKIRIITNLLKDSFEKSETTWLFKTLIGLEPDMDNKTYEEGGWYEHNISRYGTKWDVDINEHSFTFEEDSITLHFETAWSPPLNFVQTLCKTYGVEGQIDYSEPGSDFCGRTIVDAEGSMDEEDYNYLEGTYYFDKEGFWYEVESNVTYAVENELDFESFIADYDFLTEDEKQEVKEMFEKELNEHNESN